MGDFWTSRIKMSYEECKKELTEAEYDIASWEAWEEQKDADADEDKTEGRRETRNGIIN